ncbi:MAG TPA: CDP-alcohol phosphatidyltransferase family protein [Vicinamibacteria bacterium]|nr:CDP-alcohol phosphatidyltransferase family protein [Vicinamibacteria bacterium]
MRAELAVLAVVLAAAVASLFVFAVRHRGQRDPDAERKGTRFLLGIGDLLLNWFLWAIGPAERVLLRAGATPDHVNAAGLLFGVAAGILIGGGRLEAGGWAMVLAGACDVLDGRLARARELASVYGKFIDSTLDRWVETLAFLGFAAYLGQRPWGALVVAAGLGGSLLVSYAQARGESVGVSGPGGLMQRAERLFLSILGCLFDPVLSRALGLREGTVLMWVLAVIAVGALGTALHRTLWIARRLRRLS